MSGQGFRREGNNGARVVGVDLARANKSPARSRYADATRKSPMRERKSPLRGRLSGDSDSQSKSSGRSSDGDVRKSPLPNPEEIQARVKVGAWFEQVNEEVGFPNKLINPTDSFNGWLPGEATPDQVQTELNKPSGSPRKRRTWSREDPSTGFGLIQIPDQVSGRRTDEIGVEYGNFNGRSHSDEDLRYQDGYVEVYERPREADRVGVRVRPRAPIDSYEASPNYHYGAYHGYNRPANLQNVAMKQAELIRKYNELGQELQNIGNQADFYCHPDDYVHDEYIRVRRGPVQMRGLNGSPRTRHNYIGRYDEDIHNFLPSRFMPYEVPFHEDLDSPQAPRRATHREPHYYHQQFPQRRPMDSAYDHRTENLHPQHAVVRPPNRQIHRAPDYPDAKRNPTPNNLSSNSRTSAGSKSDGGSKKVLVVSKNQQLCHPIAGGAPFVTCSNCSQLLRIPQKLTRMKKNQCKLQCGSCRTISSYDFGKKRPRDSVQTNPIPVATDVFDDKSTPHNSVADIKSTGNSIPRSDSEPSTDLEDRTLNPSGAKIKPGLSPSSSQASKSSKDDNFSEAVGQPDASPTKTDKPTTKLPLRPPPGSPLRYHLEYSDILAAKRSGGKETDALSQDKGSVESESSSLNYEENAAVPSKSGQNSNDVLKPDPSIKNDQDGNSKGGQSPFSFMNTGLQDPSLGSLDISSAEAGVFVNGMSIAHDAVIRAEKMAGSIKPGEYWYDSRAGFWGLMGSPCLGIVAPFIKEFKVPMPENCSGGDTCIYVNGRELHKNDLDVLSGRGLPRTRYKYYIVDISGKVEDEDTGRFVVNLGKLAPNVEKRGRGFGMQPPEYNG